MERKSLGISKSSLLNLRKWIKSSSQRAVYTKAWKRGRKQRVQVLTMIDEAKKELDLTNEMTNDIFKLFQDMWQQGLMRGRSLESIVMTSVYIITRQNNFPITLSDIANVCEMTRKQIATCFRKMVRELDISLPKRDLNALILRYWKDMYLGNYTLTMAEKILEEAVKKRILLGKDPAGMCGAILYLADNIINDPSRCSRGITQARVASATFSSEVTIRNRFKELREKLGDTWLETMKVKVERE